MISVNNLCMEFSARPLFENLTFNINDNDRIALIGKNGAGKSTLLKILAGLEIPSEGNVNKPMDIKIGYLPQQMKISDETTLWNETLKAFEEINNIKSEIELISQKLQDSKDYDSEEYSALIERLTFLNERLEMSGSSNIEAEVESTLTGLGFKRSDFSRSTEEFSGGWRMRVELAKILLAKPDVLLLDEPTNHLDIESIQWLEQFLVNNSKAVLVVSHDRAFLDNVTKRTIEISCGHLYDYKVSYSSFVSLRKERIEQQRRAYENQQKQISDIKEFIERFRYQATKANQVQSRIKQLEKIIPIEIDDVDKSRLHLKFPSCPRSGDFPLILEDVGKAYSDHQVFNHADFMLKRGDKVAFVGKNGQGKSTLVKCIMGEIPYTGNLKIGHNIKIGYFAQNQAQLLDGELSVFETIDNVATGDMRTKVRDILGAFMFGGDTIDKKVKVLSGGEKTRLAMIKLLLEPVNFLILDEPTNHLDMTTKDVLKDAIKDFEGTVIVVSHDRYFLEGLVDKVYEFEDGEVKEHLGGIYDFLRKKNLTDLKNLNKSGNASLSAKNMNNSPKEIISDEGVNYSSGRTSYELQKEKSKAINKARKNLEACEKEVEELENRLNLIERKIAAGDVQNETLVLYNDIKLLLDKAMSDWEKASFQMEEIEGKE